MRVKKPTLAQKKLMKENGLDWKTWNVVEEDNLSITLISKKSGRRKVLLKQPEAAARIQYQNILKGSSSKNVRR